MHIRGTVRLHKVTRTIENSYTKLHKDTVVTRKTTQITRHLQRTDVI